MPLYYSWIEKENWFSLIFTSCTLFSLFMWIYIQSLLFAWFTFSHVNRNIVVYSSHPTMFWAFWEIHLFKEHHHYTVIVFFVFLNWITRWLWLRKKGKIIYTPDSVNWKVKTHITIRDNKKWNHGLTKWEGGSMRRKIKKCSSHNT